MLLLSSSIAVAIATPMLVVSACISKIFSMVTGINPVDISRASFVREITKYIPTTKGLSNVWVCGKKVHVLCRHATIFSNYPPIVIIHGTGSCSFNYSEFMESFPKVYDVYCIDLPGWGVSEDPPFDLGRADLDRCYAYYANTIMAVLAEIYPAKDAKFVFVGHSFGAFVLMKSISLYIPPHKIHKCVLVCMPGLHKQVSEYAYMWGYIFITGIMESIYKQWWSSHLFSAFLYQKQTKLQTLQFMHRFIPNGVGYKLVGRHMGFTGPLFRPEWINPICNELLNISKYRCPIKFIAGINDTIVNPKHMKDISTEVNKIEYHELNGTHSLFLQNELFPSLLAIINDSK